LGQGGNTQVPLPNTPVIVAAPVIFTKVITLLIVGDNTPELAERCSRDIAKFPEIVRLLIAAFPDTPKSVTFVTPRVLVPVTDNVPPTL
jgi:hypothetical protein